MIAGREGPVSMGAGGASAIQGRRTTGGAIMSKEVAVMKWVCDVCGYEAEGDTPPEECPVCGVDSSHFEES
jgi:rubrerythrin